MIQTILDFDLKKCFSEKSLWSITLGGLFIISLFNQWLLLAWLIIIPFIIVFKYGLNDGILITLLLYQLRQMCNNSDLCVPITSILICQLIYYSVIMIGSLYFIIHIDTDKIDRWIFYFLILFSIYAAVSSFINSSYPVVSLFKNFLYIIPMSGIICGISNSKRNDWIDFLYVTLLGFMILNYAYILNYDAYLHSKLELFRGLALHSNQLGLLCVLFQAIACTKYSSFDLKPIIILVINFIALYLTMARGQIIAFAILVLMFILTSKLDLQKKAILIVFLLLVAVVSSPVSMKTIIDFFNSKYKVTGSNAFTASRGEQFERLISQFMQKPITGTGFNVPFIKGVRDSTFYFSMPVEDGNLLLALLCQTGIIGLILFSVAYGRILVNGKGILLFFAPILISISEMAFFSTNSVGIVFYFFYAIYINNGVKEQQ